MIRRMAIVLVSTMVMGAVAAAPAMAANRGAEPTPPTVPPVGNDTPLGDDRIVEGEGVAPGTGTATAKITGVRLWAPDLDVRVLDADMLATLDHDRAGTAADLSKGYFVAASMGLGDDAPSRAVEQFDLPMSVPHPAYEAEARKGEHIEQFQEFPVLLPETDTPLGSINWEEMAGHAGDVLNWLCTEATPACDLNAAQPLNGGNALGLTQGSILDGILEPGRVHSQMNGQGAAASANSSLRQLVMMSGLSILEDAGLGDLEAVVTEEETNAVTRGLKMRSMEVLRLGALLDLIGLSADQIPDPVLAGMLDALGVNPTRLLDAATGDSVTDLYNSLFATIDDVTANVAGNTSCGLLDDGRLAAWAEEASRFDVAAPDCLGLGGLQEFLDALERVADDFVTAIHEAAQDAALLEMSNVWASTAVMASIDPEGRPSWGSHLDGGISEIAVGAHSLGGIDLRLPAETWNEREEAVNRQLAEVFGVLGPEFTDIVRIRLVPEWVEEQTVDGNYAAGRARLVLANVMVDTPEVDPAAVVGHLQTEAENLLDGVLDDLFGPLGGGAPDVPRVDLGPVDLVASRPGGSGGGAVPGMLGQTAPGQTLTLTIGEFDVMAEHTRPGVEPNCQGGCGDDSSKRVNRTWDPETGRFVPGGGGGTPPDGSLPRTGGLGTGPIGVAAVLTAAAWALGRLNRRSQPAPVD